MSDKSMYRGVAIEVDFHETCTGSGGGTPSVAEVAHVSETPVSVLAPYKNDAVVKRIVADVGCSYEKADSLFDDVVKFLMMSAKSETACIPTPAIDEGWHTFLLFTKDYAQFCENYCGTFIHHSPTPEEKADAAFDLVKPTIDQMHSALGEKPSGNWDYVSLKSWLSDDKDQVTLN